MKAFIFPASTTVLFFLFTATVSNPFSFEKTKMILVEGGTFDYEGQTVKVASFLIDEHEVTLADFEAFVNATNYRTIPERTTGCKVYNFDTRKWEAQKEVNWRHDSKGQELDKDMYDYFPVSNITLQDAQAFAKWKGKRLPTMEEWIYAAKGGNRSNNYKYSGSNSANKVAWTFENCKDDKRRSIKTKEPNELGLYDMSGNVHEFVIASGGSTFYARGGCYFSDKEFAEIYDPGWEVQSDEAFHTFGFRCVKDVKE